MNAADVLHQLGGRAPSVGDGVVVFSTTLPVEVALTASAPDATLRRTYRARQKARATPLLLIADSLAGQGLVRALGPVDDKAAVREVPGEALAAILSRLVGMPRLSATRELAEELARLDETGVPGLVVKGLLTRHLLTQRLPHSPDWTWMSATAAAVHPAEWRSILSALGYTLERRPHRGWLARADGGLILVVHPLAEAAAFARLDRDGRPPEGTLSVDCAEERVPYGMLAHGTRLRLFRMVGDPGAAATTTSYLELDIAALREPERPLIGLFSPVSLRPGGHFQRLIEDARRFGAQLRDRLDVELRERVLPHLASGIGAWARGDGRDLAEPRVRSEIEQACLAWVFRALFVLYAESAGYLPLDHAGYAANAATSLAAEASSGYDDLDPASTSLWDRFAVLVRALRTGDRGMHVPAYNGDLFAAGALPGARTLEDCTLPNAVFGRVLAALGRDPETGVGVDYSSLEIGHLGHLYEGLLSLKVSLADSQLGLYRAGAGNEERFEPARRPQDVVVQPGELFWQTNTGGRKAAGVYYTPTLLVEHLVTRAVLPTLAEHLQRVRTLASADPTAAAAELFRFRVLDPACGSAHFLVAALHRIAERIDRFLAETPLPAVRDEIEALHAATGTGFGSRIEHAELLHRLVLKRCIFGVDVSRMGAEVARLSLWLAAFVPGLSLAYLGHNVQVGDSLIGVADPAVIAGSAASGQASFWDDQVETAISEAAAAAAELAGLTDRTPAEVAESREAAQRLTTRTAAVRRLYDAWTVGPLGLPEARAAIVTNPEKILNGSARISPDVRAITDASPPLHWPLAFPEIFAGDRQGFDAVIGNPPWEEVTVEELAFYARHSPRLRGLDAGPRGAALAQFKAARPELGEEFAAEQVRTQRQRAFLGPAGGYLGSVGDPDLYKFFCQRYRLLLAPGGRLGVVLPRSTFLTAGSRPFRLWLFDECRVERLDFLLNRGFWMFQTHPQYTVALLAAANAAAAEEHRVQVAGVAASAAAFREQSDSNGIATPRSALGSGDEVPLLPSQAAATVLARIRQSGPFGLGGGRWQCFPVAEFHETADRKLWQGHTAGWELWKGESFDQFDPHGRQARYVPPTEAALEKARKPRPGKGSVVAAQASLSDRKATVAAQIGQVRLAFRDVTNRTNSRTVIASLVPAETFLTNKAPYLAFVQGGFREMAVCCAVMNSLPFDWQARRFVEINLNFFILELLAVPALGDDVFEELVALGGRLSAPDERFAEVAAACGVQAGRMTCDERLAARARIDALVTHSFGLGLEQLDVVFDDFTYDALPQGHRDLVWAELERLCR